MTTIDIEQNPELEEDRPRRRSSKRTRIHLSQRCAYCGQKLPYEAYKDSKGRWVEPEPDDVVQRHVMNRQCIVLEVHDPGRGIEVKERYRAWDAASAKREVARRR